jgi:site-specific recombinase XerD
VKRIRLPSGQGVVELRYLYADFDRHGNQRWYVKRKDALKIRLTLTPDGSEAFLEQYRAALNGVSPKAPKVIRPAIKTTHEPGSLRYLLSRYYESAEYRRLGTRTKMVRRAILDSICEETIFSDAPTGSLPYAMMEPRHVRQIRDVKAELPEAANARVKALRQVFKWATDDTVKMADTDPSKAVKYLQGNPEGWHAWTISEIHQYWKAHPIGTRARLALDLLLFTMVRRSDLVKLGPQMESNGSLRFRETKGRDRIIKDREIPILPPLRASIDATKSGHLAYLITQSGKPFTANGFGNWFKKQCRAAGLDHCSAHGMRKAAATIAGEQGATTLELQAMGGWTTLKEPERYTRTANKKKLAAGAMHKVIPEQNADESCPPESDMAESGQYSPSKALKT